MLVSREKLLTQLESVVPGLATKETITQSNCFVFTGKWVITFNETIACRVPCESELIGAVEAKGLLELLRRMPDAELDVNVEGEPGAQKCRITGKSNRRGGVPMAAEILLPVQGITPPAHWLPLPQGFAEAVETVAPCAAKSGDSYGLKCVHVHPHYVEASDNFHMARYPLLIPVTAPTLVLAQAIKNACSLGAMEFSESADWLHFRNPNGAILSCRRLLDAYFDFSAYLQPGGEVLTLPAGLDDAVAAAGIFSAEAAENEIFITVENQWFYVRGVGNSGWYEERRPCNYSGPRLQFKIAPKILTEITKRHNQCMIAPGRLLIDTGKFQYATCLGVVNG